MDNHAWSFALKFKDNEKEMCDKVDKLIERVDLERIDTNIWKTTGPNSQYLALEIITRQEWVMEEIESITCFENNKDVPIDYIEIIEKVFPERIRR